MATVHFRHCTDSIGTCESNYHTSLCFIFFHLLARKPNRKFSIYSKKKIIIFTCPGLRASGLAWRQLYDHDRPSVFLRQYTKNFSCCPLIGTISSVNQFDDPETHIFKTMHLRYWVSQRRVAIYDTGVLWTLFWQL